MTAKKAASTKVPKATGNRDRTRYEEQFLKTKLCSFYERGKCTRGHQCTFAHGNFELQQLPDLTKTSLCPAFTEFGVCEDDTCLFAHGVEELRATKKFYKTSMCKFHMMRQCRMGAYCRHAHDESELRMDLRAAYAQFGDVGLSTFFDNAELSCRQNSSDSRPRTSTQTSSTTVDEDGDIRTWPAWDLPTDLKPDFLADVPWRSEVHQPRAEPCFPSAPWISDIFPKMGDQSKSILSAPSWHKEQTLREFMERPDAPPGLLRAPAMDITLSL